MKSVAVEVKKALNEIESPLNTDYKTWTYDYLINLNGQQLKALLKPYYCKREYHEAYGKIKAFAEKFFEKDVEDFVLFRYTEYGGLFVAFENPNKANNTIGLYMFDIDEKEKTISATWSCVKLSSMIDEYLNELDNINPDRVCYPYIEKISNEHLMKIGEKVVIPNIDNILDSFGNNKYSAVFNYETGEKVRD